MATFAPSGVMDDIYLLTTDLRATSEWVIGQFAWRWSIEVLFRASKQTMEIEAPQHWFEASVEKVAPWVGSMQSVILVWYLTFRAGTAPSSRVAAADGGVGQRVVLETHGSGAAQRDPRYRIRNQLC